VKDALAKAAHELIGHVGWHGPTEVIEGAADQGAARKTTLPAPICPVVARVLCPYQPPVNSGAGAVVDGHPRRGRVGGLTADLGLG
jgi:hypothetical protein